MKHPTEPDIEEIIQIIKVGILLCAAFFGLGWWFYHR